MNRICTIDIGNTAVKSSIFSGSELCLSIVNDGFDAEAIIRWALENGAEGLACCSVRDRGRELCGRLKKQGRIPVFELTNATALPFEVDYRSRDTLGVDRIAAAGGAWRRYKGDVLVVDAGTAMTIDLVGRNGFKGGNISPGLRLRFKSLNAFTGRLPLVRPEGPLPERGYDTQTAIRCGVVRGLVAEIVSAYKETKQQSGELTLVMTGGDADFLLPLVRESGIEARIDHELVGLGLVSIYNYNRK